MLFLEVYICMYWPHQIGLIVIWYSYTSLSYEDFPFRMRIVNTIIQYTQRIYTVNLNALIEDTVFFYKLPLMTPSRSSPEMHCILFVNLISHLRINIFTIHVRTPKQLKKVSETRKYLSWFLALYRSVPQGSILGPFIFSVFINDILYFVSYCDLYNFTDDITFSNLDNDIKALKNKL